jgi:hypothetical protein
MAIYQKHQVETWIPLDEHLKNPGNFPRGITSGFLVVFTPPPQDERLYPLRPGNPILFLGEIPGMRGHGIFVGNDGLVRFGYHTHDFRVIPEDEL